MADPKPEYTAFTNEPYQAEPRSRTIYEKVTTDHAEYAKIGTVMGTNPVLPDGAVILEKTVEANMAGNPISVVYGIPHRHATAKIAQPTATQSIPMTVIPPLPQSSGATAQNKADQVKMADAIDAQNTGGNVTTEKAPQPALDLQPSSGSKTMNFMNDYGLYLVLFFVIIFAAIGIGIYYHSPSYVVPTQERLNRR